jgi:hypothetical protein
LTHRERGGGVVEREGERAKSRAYEGDAVVGVGKGLQDQVQERGGVLAAVEAQAGGLRPVPDMMKMMEDGGWRMRRERGREGRKAREA